MNTVDISYRHIGRIAGPVLITNFSYTAMGLIDTIMVGRLGVTSLAAVGLGNLVAFALLSFFWGMLSGVNTLVAQAVGARDRVAVARVFFQGLYLSLVAGLVISLGWPLLVRLVAWIGPSPEVEAIAVDYMRIRILGSWGVVLLWAADNFYRGLGRTTVTMWSGFGQLILNCGLNYLLIFGRFGFPEMGTTGAALGTVLAQFVVGVSLVATIVVARGVRAEFDIWKHWRLRMPLFVRLFRLSLPIGVQTCLEMGGVTVFTGIVARLGDAELAATNAVIQAWSVAFMGAFALSVGATTLVGQCVGSGELEQARVVVRRVTVLGYLLTVAVGSIYVLFPHQLMGLFASGDELQRLLPFARPLFTVVVLCLVFDLKFNILSGALRGAGDTTYSMLVNVGSAWLVFVPALLLVTPRYGLIGAWSCFILHVFVMAALLQVRVRGRRWLERAPQHRSEGGDAAAEPGDLFVEDSGVAGTSVPS
jgi:MATE family multidrug resistance protein